MALAVDRLSRALETSAALGEGGRENPHASTAALDARRGPFPWAVGRSPIGSQPAPQRRTADAEPVARSRPVCRVSPRACRDRLALAIGPASGSPPPSGRNTTSPSSSEPCFRVRARPPNAMSRSRVCSAAMRPAVRKPVEGTPALAGRIQHPAVRGRTRPGPSLNVSIHGCPRGAKLCGAGRLGVFSLATIRSCITEFAGQGSREHRPLVKTRAALGGHSAECAS